MLSAPFLVKPNANNAVNAAAANEHYANLSYKESPAKIHKYANLGKENLAKGSDLVTMNYNGLSFHDVAR